MCQWLTEALMTQGPAGNRTLLSIDRRVNEADAVVQESLEVDVAEGRV